MDPELKIYLIVGAIVTAVLTLIFHYPLDIAWLPAFIAAFVVTFFGVFVVVNLD